MAAFSLDVRGRWWRAGGRLSLVERGLGEASGENIRSPSGIVTSLSFIDPRLDDDGAFGGPSLSFEWEGDGVAARSNSSLVRWGGVP